MWLSTKRPRFRNNRIYRSKGLLLLLGCVYMWIAPRPAQHLPCRVGGLPMRVVESYPPSYPHSVPLFPPFGLLVGLPSVVSPELSTPLQIGIDIGISSGIVDRWPTRMPLQMPGYPPSCPGACPGRACSSRRALEWLRPQRSARTEPAGRLPARGRQETGE